MVLFLKPKKSLKRWPNLGFDTDKCGWGSNVPSGKSFIYQARRSIDCFQDSMPLENYKTLSEGPAEAYNI